MNRKGTTLPEIIVTVVIISVVASLAIGAVTVMKERSYDAEVKQNLILIQRAERVFRTENGTYYPNAGSQNNIANINQNLGLHLPNPAAAQRIWNYTVWSSGCSRATRNGSGARSWFLTIANEFGDPVSGAGCP